MVTTGASYLLPPVAQCFRQSYPEATLQRLLTLHGEAHAFVRLHRKLEPLASAPSFESSFAHLQHRREQALRAVRLWPLWLLLWRATLPYQHEGRALVRSP